jgi:hypothetical protein
MGTLLAMNMQDELITSVEVEVCFRRDVTTKKFWIELPIGSNPNEISLFPVNLYSESWV